MHHSCFIYDSRSPIVLSNLRAVSIHVSSLSLRNLNDQTPVSYILALLQAPGYGDIRLTVTSMPDAIQVEKVFILQVTVTNCW